MLAGVPVSRGLVHTALLGIAAFVLYAIFGVIVLRADRPLATLGRAAQSLWNKVTRGRRPVTGLDQRLLAERDTIRAVLGKNWRQAAVLTAGRLGFDYGCLLAALRATGASPQPSLVLLAYAAVGIVALFPITPGGLGIVEASLSGLLILAGVHPGYAVLATLAYRIASYWLPLLAGPPAYLLFRHRYGRPAPRRATPTGPANRQRAAKRAVTRLREATAAPTKGELGLVINCSGPARSAQKIFPNGRGAPWLGQPRQDRHGGLRPLVPQSHGGNPVRHRQDCDATPVHIRSPGWSFAALPDRRAVTGVGLWPVRRAWMVVKRAARRCTR